MLSPYKIRWQNMSSLELDLWTEISFDSDEGEIETYLNREAVASETHNGVLKRVYNYKWNEVLTPKITFVKQNYEDFTSEENRRILSWLTSSSTSGFLDVYKDDSEVISFCILGNFTVINQHKITNGRIIGYTVEFESVSPFAFSPLKTITKDVSNPEDNAIVINVRTDDIQSPIYPRITIKQNDNITTTSVTIQNNIYADNDNEVDKTFDTVVKNNNAKEIIVLDGANKVISSDRAISRIFGDDFDWKWLPFYKGRNELYFVGDCEVTIEYREPIKCGGF